MGLFYEKKQGNVRDAPSQSRRVAYGTLTETPLRGFEMIKVLLPRHAG